MGLSLDFAEEYLKAFTGYNAAFSIKPCYLGLSTTIPNNDGTNFTEPNAALGYRRLLLTDSHNNTVFGNVTISGGIASTTNVQEVINCVATGSWGVIRYIGLFNAQSGGSPLVFAPVSASFSVGTDELPVLGIGDLTLSIGYQNCGMRDNVLSGYLGFFSGVNAYSYLRAACYLGLSKTAPNADGTNFTEPDMAYGYSRMPLGYNSPSNFHIMSLANAIGDGSYYVFNTEQITFPMASYEWGELTHFGLFSSPTLGLPVLWGELKTAVEIHRDYVPIFKYGALSIRLT